MNMNEETTNPLTSTIKNEEIFVPSTLEKTDLNVKDVQTGGEKKQSHSRAVQGLLENTTITKDFKPTASMVVWLDSAIRTESDNISEIAENCEPKIDRTNWYRWLDIPGFIDWFKNEWDRKLKGNAWKLDVVGMKRAKVDHKYWHDMQNRVGNLLDKPSTLQQFNVSGEMNVEFTE